MDTGCQFFGQFEFGCPEAKSLGIHDQTIACLISHPDFQRALTLAFTGIIVIRESEL